MISPAPGPSNYRMMHKTDKISPENGLWAHLLQQGGDDAGGHRNGVALGDLPGVEQVEFDAAGDLGDAGLAGFARREVSGLLGLAGTGPAGAVADEEAGQEDLHQERGQCQVCLVRGGKPRPWRWRPAGRAES